MSLDEVLASLLGEEIEGRAEQGNGGDTLFDEAGAAFGGEVAIGAGVGEEIAGLVHGEEFVVLRRTAVAPEKHFLGDELVAGGALFLDDIAAAEHQQGGRFLDGGGAQD